MTGLLTMNPTSPDRLLALAVSLFAGCCLWAALVAAQSAPAAKSPPSAQAPAAAVPAPAPAETPTPAVPAKELRSLSWLEGCWKGEVAQYEFLEHWLPLRGGLMIGAAHVLFQGKSQDFEYLRLETRADGVYYVAIPSGKKETPFRLATITIEEKDTIFTFANPVDEFPQRIIYRRGTEGWLYATVEGTANGKEQRVIYPMRRVDCQSGALIQK